MMRPIHRIIGVLTVILTVMSCGSRHDDRSVVVPRPEAYPRIEMPDSSYRELEAVGARMSVNDGTTTIYTDRGKGTQWITIKYPVGMETKVYLTLTSVASVDSMAEVSANRRERMALNLAGADGLLTTLTSEGGWECELLTSWEALSTPVQIMARKDNMILSGALYLQVSSGTSADSVAPVIDAVDRDMLVLLKSLR